MKNRKGQSLVESALILAAFMGLLLALVGLGETLFVRATLVDRVHTAARWGAVNPYNAEAIRNVVLYGAATPASDATPLVGLTPAGVLVANPGCPGVECRITVSIAAHGVQSTEPAEIVTARADAAPSTP